MPNYLLHLTRNGDPVGVYAENHDYYDPKWIQLRAEGRQLVDSKLPRVTWEDFIELLASTTPSATMRWDTYRDASRNLRTVLEHAQSDVVEVGNSDSE